MSDRIFIDTNVLVYAALATSAFHASARDAIDSSLDRGASMYAFLCVL